MSQRFRRPLQRPVGRLRLSVIKWLGGVPAEELERQRVEHEQWAINNLTSKEGYNTPDCGFYNPWYADRVCVIRSGMTVLPGAIAQVTVAPWCRGVVLNGLSNVSPNAGNQRRA